jgi:RNA polymerase sigma factor (sigma-70 family)
MALLFWGPTDKKGKEAEFNEIVLKLYKSIYNYCRHKYNLDIYSAEDCTQEVFTTLYKEMGHLHDLDKIEGWLYRTADNFSKRTLMRLSKELKTTDSIENLNIDISDENDPVEDHFELINEDSININEYMTDVFKKLTEVEIVLWSLYFGQGKSVSEVATILKLKEGATKERITRLRHKIKKIARGMLGEEKTTHV